MAAEYRVDSSHRGRFAFLVSYNFIDGVFVSKDTIIGLPTDYKGRKGPHARYDLGRNFIYQNRYVISGTGSVIDTKTRSLVMEESDDFIEALGDTLVFHRNNVITGTGFLHLVLSKRTYGFINHEERNRDQRFSPDKAQSVYINQSSLPYKIELSTKFIKRKVIVSDAGNGPNLTGGCSFPQICTYWLDNHTIIYSIHRIIVPMKEEIFSTVTLRKYNTITGADEQFAVLDSVWTGDINDRVYKDDIGQMIYRSAEGTPFVIDTINHSLIPYTAYQMGHGFSRLVRFNSEFGKTILYHEKEIGKLWSTDETASNGIIGVAYGPVGSNLGYPAGIQVWSEQTNKWISFKIPWLSAVIGWVEN